MITITKTIKPYFISRFRFCRCDSLQNRELFDIFWEKVYSVVINQYIFELTIVISRREKNDVNIQYRNNENNRIIFWDEFVFKYFVNKNVNNCRECFNVVYQFNENKKCLKFVVDFCDEFIMRDFLLWNIIDNQFFAILNDEFVYVIVFVIDNKLLKTTFKFWTFFVCRVTIDKTFFRFFAFFFDMIRVEDINNKTHSSIT